MFAITNPFLVNFLIIFWGRKELSKYFFIFYFMFFFVTTATAPNIFKENSSFLTFFFSWIFASKNTWWTSARWGLIGFMHFSDLLWALFVYTSVFFAFWKGGNGKTKIWGDTQVLVKHILDINYGWWGVIVSYGRKMGWWGWSSF